MSNQIFKRKDENIISKNRIVSFFLSTLKIRGMLKATIYRSFHFIHKQTKMKEERTSIGNNKIMGKSCFIH